MKMQRNRDRYRERAEESLERAGSMGTGWASRLIHVATAFVYVMLMAVDGEEVSE